MNKDIGIVRTHRQSNDLSIRKDNQNTLTHQSAATNDSPRNTLHVPFTVVYFSQLLLITISEL